MNTIRSFVPAIALVASFFAGCATETEVTEKLGKSMSMSTNSPDRVTGTYRQEGNEIYFESARFNGVTYLTVTALDGSKLLETSSDAKKLDVKALEARPEFAAIRGLSSALTEAGVSKDLTDCVSGL